MRIFAQNHDRSYKKPTFGTRKLMNISLQKIMRDNSIKEIPAAISTFLPEDIKVAKKILPMWLYKSDFGGDILINFIAKTEMGLTDIKDKNGMLTHFYAIERKDRTDPIEKFRALAMIESSKKETHINYIQSASVFPMAEELKGAGELILYYIVKKAKEQNQKMVSLISAADSWYQKLGWVVPSIKDDILTKNGNLIPKHFNEKTLKNNKVFLPNEAFDKFLKLIEKKYNIKT